MFHFHIKLRTHILSDVFVALLCLGCKIVSSNVADVCRDVNDGCRCVHHGKTVVDLTKSAYTNGTARFNNVKSISNDIYFSYNPCFPFTEINSTSLKADTKCDNVTICARNGTHYNTTAVQDDARFNFDPSRKQYYVQYKNPEVPAQYTKVYLLCKQTEELRVHQAMLMSLYSPQLCDEIGGLSPGSVLLLIFFSFLLCYMVIGCLVNKAIFGAEGKDIIPNYSGWKELGALIKDGYMFFLSPCLGDRVQYNNVYQNI